MERNRNIDILRALSILLIVVYHIYALSGVPLIRGKFGDFIEYGGEYGVVLFFILSGFSIYKSLYKRKDNFKYTNFIKDRLIRILPQYYISLLILLLFSTNVILLFSKDGNYNIITHILLIHGFFPSYQGSISGVCWALTPIFCFYLLAPFIFNIIEKKPKITLIISIIISCLFKALSYNFFASKSSGFIIYFIWGRSIFGAIDEFILGMFLAKYIKVPKDNKKIILNVVYILLSIILLYFWIYVDKNNVNIIFENTNRMSNCFEGYIWYTVLSIILAIGIYGFSQIKLNFQYKILETILYLSKHEYGIYIWHLEFIRIACQSNPYIQSLIASNRRLVYLYLGTVSLFVGILMSKMIDNLDLKSFKIIELNNINNKMRG